MTVAVSAVAGLADSGEDRGVLRPGATQIPRSRLSGFHDYYRDTDSVIGIPIVDV